MDVGLPIGFLYLEKRGADSKETPRKRGIEQPKATNPKDLGGQWTCFLTAYSTAFCGFKKREQEKRPCPKELGVHLFHPPLAKPFSGLAGDFLAHHGARTSARQARCGRTPPRGTGSPCGSTWAGDCHRLRAARGRFSGGPRFFPPPPFLSSFFFSLPARFFFWLGVASFLFFVGGYLEFLACFPVGVASCWSLFLGVPRVFLLTPCYKMVGHES